MTLMTTALLFEEKNVEIKSEYLLTILAHVKDLALDSAFTLDDSNLTEFNRYMATLEKLYTFRNVEIRGEGLKMTSTYFV